jgi:hypothetical protein
MINMVVMLPWEFRIDTRDMNSKDETAAQLMLDPQQCIFDKPDESRHWHLKALYVSKFVNGKPMSKILVDGGAATNIMSMTTFRRIGKGSKDLIKINVILKDFKGGTSKGGVINVKLTIRSKTITTSFFVISGKGLHSLLLRRD